MAPRFVGGIAKPWENRCASRCSVAITVHAAICLGDILPNFPSRRKTIAYTDDDVPASGLLSQVCTSKPCHRRHGVWQHELLIRPYEGGVSDSECASRRCNCDKRDRSKKASKILGASERQQLQRDICPRGYIRLQYASCHAVQENSCPSAQTGKSRASRERKIITTTGTITVTIGERYR